MIKLANGRAAIGFVIRNSSGDPLLSGGRALGQSYSIFQAEARGLLEGVSAAATLNIDRLLVEGDNLTVINSIRKCWKIPCEIHYIVLDIVSKIPLFNSFQAQHCYRETNKVADLMAN